MIKRSYPFLATLAILVMTILGLVVFSDNTYADAWMGTNGGSTTTPGGGGGGGVGSSIYDTGVSWMKYEYIGGDEFKGLAISFVPNNGLYPAGHQPNPNDLGYISGQCAYPDKGFWHFGRNQYAYLYADRYSAFAHFSDERQVLYSDWDGAWDIFRYSTKSTANGAWGHLGTNRWRDVEKYPYMNFGQKPGGQWGWIGFNLDHYIYAWSSRDNKYKPIYRAVDISAEVERVWPDYVAAAQQVGWSVGSPGSYPGELYAFCAGGQSNTKPTVTVKYEVVSCADSDGREFRDPDVIEIQDGQTSITVNADPQIQDNGKTYNFMGWEGVTTHEASATVDTSNGSKTIVKRYYDPNVDCSGEPEPDPGTSSCAQWTPSSYTSSNELSGTTSVVSAARNLSISNQNSEWHGSGNAENGPSLVAPSSYVYAKPTDRVAWLHCYFPGVQTTINSTVSHNNIHEEDKNLSGFVDSSIQNHTFQEYGGWENRFSVSSNNLVSHTIANASGNFSLGDTSVHEVPDDYTVEVSHLRAGLELKESIQTGFPVNASTNNTGVHSWSCHWYESNDAKCDSDCVSYTWEDVTNDEGEVTGQRRVCASWRPRSCYGDTCYHDKDFWSNSHGGTTSDNAIVKVPYNYENSSTVGLSGSILYSGEKVQINSLDTKVKVDTRNNQETVGDYATQVPDAKVRLIAYISATDDSGRSEQKGVGNASDGNDNSHGLCRFLNVKPSTNRCEQLDSDDKTLNPDAEYGGVETTVKFSGGTYNVFDEAAGNYFCVVSAVYPYTVADDRDMEKKGSDNWYISQPSCLIMAKKPAFQVWGAGIFSAGNINTVVSTKNNIKNYVNWGPTGGTEYTFGSWDELSVTLAKPGSSDTIASGASTGYRGGLPSAGYPYSGNPGGLSGTSFCTRNPLTIANTNCNSSVGNANLDTLLSTLTTDREVIRNRFNASGGDITVNNYPGGTTIGNVTVDYAKTIVDIIDGDATIGEGLRYADGYNTIYQIPKHIIYASGDITIGCDVTRIDAILIAGGTVNTCNNGDANSRDRSNQLVINGAVIANRFSFNRSFGTGTGGYSISPAELINYDSSIYLWANRSASGAFSGQLTETASRELAPRY